MMIGNIQARPLCISASSMASRMRCSRPDSMLEQYRNVVRMSPMKSFGSSRFEWTPYKPLLAKIQNRTVAELLLQNVAYLPCAVTDGVQAYNTVRQGLLNDLLAFVHNLGIESAVAVLGVFMVISPIESRYGMKTGNQLYGKTGRRILHIIVTPL